MRNKDANRSFAKFRKVDAVTGFEVMYRTCYSYVAEIRHHHQNSHRVGASCWPGQAPSNCLYECPSVLWSTWYVASSRSGNLFFCVLPTYSIDLVLYLESLCNVGSARNSLNVFVSIIIHQNAVPHSRNTFHFSGCIPVLSFAFEYL
jgi:hypothetical protein